MAVKTPIFLENDTTTQNADELRLERYHMTGGISGVVGTTSYAVSERGAGANMSVDVASGGAVIVGTEDSLQGSYFVTNDATVNLAVTAADATNPRKDLVVLYVRDSFYSGANNDAQLVVVAGTPAASPSEPDLDALGYENYLVLALIDVPASDTAISNAQITNRRDYVSAVGSTLVVTSSTRPAGPYEGQRIYETDTDRELVYNGSDWTLPKTFGAYVCTAATRPASGIYEGMQIYETDTNRHYHYSGAVWVPRTSSFRGIKNVSQSITSGVDTDVAWAEDTDVDGWHTGTNVEATVPTGYQGLTTISATLRFASDTNGQRQMKIVLNGTTVIASDRKDADAGGPNYLTAAATIRLSPGDDITVVVNQDSGSALNVESTHAQLLIGFVAD
jgi:hypothetical protein